MALALALASLALAPGAARADTGPGAFRLALSAELFGYARTSYGATSTGGLGALVSDTEQLRFGFLTPRLGLELSVVVAPIVLVGVTGALGYRRDAVGSGASETIDWVARPWLEVALLPGDRVRPFFRAEVGAAGASTGDATDRRDDAGGARLVQFVLAGTAGLHLFATESVSIDPTLSVAWRIGDQVIESALSSTTRGVEGVEVTIGFAVAAWLGGRPAQPTPEAEPSSATSREDLGRSVHATRTAPVADGALRTDVRITGDARARIEARPREDAERNELTIVRIARTATPETCTQAGLRSTTGTATATLSTRARPYLNAVEETLVIVTTASGLELLGAEGAVIDACGTEIALSSGARAAIRTHLARFHSLVTSYGTASRAAPASDPADAARSDDAPFVAPTPTPEVAPSAVPSPS